MPTEEGAEEKEDVLWALVFLGMVLGKEKDKRERKKTTKKKHQGQTAS